MEILEVKDVITGNSSSVFVTVTVNESVVVFPAASTTVKVNVSVVVP